MVQRAVHLGFEVRVELVRSGGQHVVAQLTKAEADQLELHDGSIVWLRAPLRSVVNATTA